MGASGQGHVLAIDLGTSGAKVGLVSEDGHVVEWAFRPTPVELLPDSGAEQDPALWWKAVTDATQDALAASGVSPEGVIALACTGQWSGTVPIGRDLRAIGNAMIWLDARGAPLIEDLIGGPVRIKGYAPHKVARWIRLTGGAPEKSGKDPVAHIHWLRRHRPDLYRKTMVFLEPKDYLNLQLTGVVAAGFDSIALHWVTDNRAVDDVHYSRSLLEVTGLDRGKLPELRPATDVLGPLLPQPAAQLGLRPEIPVVMGTPDIHSAAIGSGAIDDYQAHLYLGTSSWLVCHVPFKKTDLMHNMASLPSALPGKWLLVNEQESAGACLTYLAERLRILPHGVPHDAELAEIYDGYDRMAGSSIPGSNGVVFAPWIHGERPPVEDSRLKAGFFTLSPLANVNDLVHSVFEGVALNTRWLLHHVEKFVSRRIDEIRVVGGGAQSDVWCQLHADVLGRTVVRTEEPRLANLRGVAQLAFLSLGLLQLSDLPGNAAVARVFYPRTEFGSLYERRFDEFLDIYRATRRMTRKSGRV